MTRVNRLFLVNGRWDHARNDMQRRSLERPPVTCRRKRTRLWVRGKLRSGREIVRRAEIWPVAGGRSEEREIVCSSPRGNPFLRKVGNEWREPPGRHEWNDKSWRVTSTRFHGSCCGTREKTFLQRHGRVFLKADFFQSNECVVFSSVNFCIYGLNSVYLLLY